MKNRSYLRGGRIIQGSLVTGSTVQQYMCYYSLLRQDNVDFLIDSVVDDKTFCSNEYVACFLAGVETGLDLFRSELDKYCSDLLANLEADLSDLNIIVKTFLENWYESVMEYVCRCVQRLGDDTCYFIYVALMNGRLEIDGGDEQMRTDIDRFVESCSLSELLSQNNNKTNSESKLDGTSPQSESESMLVDVRDIGVEDTEYNLKLTLDGDKNVLNKRNCSRFCEDWGRILCSGYTDNPVYLRQIIDNYKLKAIQDMNTLKRLLRQAETDHYALYRCAMFLKNCGNSAVLLRHAKYEDHTLATQDTANVLQVIEEFLKDTESGAETV